MRKRIYSTKYGKITAAEGDMEDSFDDNFDDMGTFSDDISDVADAVEDLQDIVEEDEDEADTILDIENNITDHYIAECEHCHEVFISAVIESETPMESISGECPLCHEVTDQDLKWIIRSVNSINKEDGLI